MRSLRSSRARCRITFEEFQASRPPLGARLEARSLERSRHSAPSMSRSIRTKLQVEGRIRDFALFSLAIDSKLRGCEVVALKVEDIAPSDYAFGLPLLMTIAILVCSPPGGLHNEDEGGENPTPASSPMNFGCRNDRLLRQCANRFVNLPSLASTAASCLFQSSRPALFHW